MSDDTVPEKQPGGMGLADIYFVLFRQKWIILFCTAVGLAGALTIFTIKPPRYYSEAKLFIRYVEDGKTPAPPGTTPAARALDDQQASVLNTEAQFLRSSDVAHDVVKVIGAEKILAKVGGGADENNAASLVVRNLEIELHPLTDSVIGLSFQHPDSDIAHAVLEQIIVAYVKKHKEMRQTVAIFDDFLVQKTASLTTDLADTERQLKDAKSKAGVTSLDDAKKRNSEQVSKKREELFHSQAELASFEAVVKSAPAAVPASASGTNVQAEVTPQQINEYKQVCARLDRFSNRLEELLLYFVEGSQTITEARQQINDTQELKKKLEQDHPTLTRLNLPPPGALTQTVVSDPRADAALQVQMLRSKINVLVTQMDLLQSEAAKMDEMEQTIVDLQRKKDLQETDLKYFSEKLEQSRVDKAVGSGKAPNIGVLDPPTPPSKAWAKSFKKKVQMIGVGGFLGGIALAFLIELFLDRSVKRPADIERKLGLPMFISIPNVRLNGKSRFAWLLGKKAGHLHNGNGNGAPPDPETPAEALALPQPAWDRTHQLRRFYEGLRDRLLVYFEVRNLNHKPKLVAVTSCSRGAGVTSTAAGLAASLSETGDGNVLLVDMNAEQGSSQQFRKGKPACRLDAALESETMKSALVRSNLYVATERADSEQLPQVLPKRFASLMPKLKASDYDYIIFDLPPITQTSMTPRVARLMDMVLLVIEAEKTSQDVVQQATALLAESKATVSTVLNKSRSYVPSRLQQQLSDV